jgi:adenine-specific DNA-methyltransferase
MKLLLDDIETTRLRWVERANSYQKFQLGQYFTSVKIAKFMAGLFEQTGNLNCRIIDPGAGIGVLTAAFLDRVASGELRFDHLHITAFEVDKSLHRDLTSTLSLYSEFIPFTTEVVWKDYIEESRNLIQGNEYGGFTHAILNPPYKKITRGSRYDVLLAEVGIDAVNLYAAFVALTVRAMESNGQLVAILPRSFCSGTYYLPFREFILRETAIRHIHLFDSRKRLFKDDQVLQENIIVVLEKNGKQDWVTVTKSTDENFKDITSDVFRFTAVVEKSDKLKFIRIPSKESDLKSIGNFANKTLEELKIDVSTGPIVDFRNKKFLRNVPGNNTVPVIYPGNVNKFRLDWPSTRMKKPNSIVVSNNTDKLLYPLGYYCVTRRFSSKEEKRRIIPGLIRPSDFRGVDKIGFENHLNIFHRNKRGLEKNLSLGSVIYLGTSFVDRHFRSFNGHTQVNAMDLKTLRYPSEEKLTSLGKWGMKKIALNQEITDDGVLAHLSL